MYEGVDTVVLYDELACHDVLPVQWKPLSRPLDRFELLGLDESNLLLLQACIAVEEHPARDKKEELDPLAAELARLDFKLNMVLQLLSKLVPHERIATPTTIQFNSLGASWTALGPTPALGESGILRVQLRGSLPQPLELLAAVSAVNGATVRVKFPELAAGTVQLMQKLAFLRHRRHVADARKARGG
ncbi:MAG: PilZ domain-containing protein [Steroidobacterales bacterium]